MHNTTRSRRNFDRNSHLLEFLQRELGKDFRELRLRNGCTFADTEYNVQRVGEELHRVAHELIRILPQEDLWLCGNGAPSIRDQLWPESNRIDGLNPLTICEAQWVDGPDGEFPATIEGLKAFFTWVKDDLVTRGCNGVETVAWRYDPFRLLDDDAYRDQILEIHGLVPRVDVLSSHLIGQCVTDPIRKTHQGILPPEVWGDGFPFGVNFRAGLLYMTMPVASKRLGLNDVTHGFCGGANLWQVAYDFVRSQEDVEAGLMLLASYWFPIMRVYWHLRHVHALEIHGTEAAWDGDSFQKTKSALPQNEWGIGFDRSHFIWQGLDPVGQMKRFSQLLYHVHLKSVRFDLTGQTGIMRGLESLGTYGGGWQFHTIGEGHDWRRGPERIEEDLIALNELGYHGNVSAENEQPRAARKGRMTRAIENIAGALYAPTTLNYLPA